MYVFHLVHYKRYRRVNSSGVSRGSLIIIYRVFSSVPAVHCGNPSNICSTLCLFVWSSWANDTPLPASYCRFGLAKIKISKAGPLQDKDILPGTSGWSLLLSPQSIYGVDPFFLTGFLSLKSCKYCLSILVCQSVLSHGVQLLLRSPHSGRSAAQVSRVHSKQRF